MGVNIRTVAGFSKSFAMLLGLALLTSAHLASAQIPGKNLPDCPTTNAYAQVEVKDAYKVKDKEKSKKVALNDNITVEIPNLSTLLAKANCTIPTKKILLYVDERPIKDVTPFPPTDPNEQLLKFPLKFKRTEQSSRLLKNTFQQLNSGASKKSGYRMGGSLVPHKVLHLQWG